MKKNSFTNRFLENLLPSYAKVGMFLMGAIGVLLVIIIIAAIVGTIWSMIF
jgi:hypothetical protein